MPIEVLGIREVLKALSDLDPEAKRGIDKALREAMAELVNTGRSFVDPQGLSGWGKWRGGYSASTIAGGIKPTRAQARKKGSAVRNVAGVINSTPAGAIWEVAGRRSRGADKRGAAFIRNIENRGGAASRTVWAAADQTDMGSLEERVGQVLTYAAQLVQKQIDNAS